jgi:hypothetical protein
MLLFLTGDLNIRKKTIFARLCIRMRLSTNLFILVVAVGNCNDRALSFFGSFFTYAFLYKSLVLFSSTVVLQTKH